MHQDDRADSVADEIATKLESPIFRARWLLYPINVGLIVGLFAYVLQFMVDLCGSLYRFHGNEELMLAMLGLIDTAMVANLVVMIIQGTHQIFVKKFGASHKPQWLEHIDSTLLKLKLGLSVAGITMVRTLKDFIDIEHIDWVIVEHRIILHLVFLFSALIMATIWRITHHTPEHT